MSTISIHWLFEQEANRANSMMHIGRDADQVLIQAVMMCQAIITEWWG